MLVLEGKGVALLLLLHHHLTSIDDVQALAGSSKPLAREVEVHRLHFMLVSADVADANSARGIHYPIDVRLLTLASAIIDALDADFCPVVEDCWIVVEIDAVGTVP